MVTGDGMLQNQYAELHAAGLMSDHSLVVIESEMVLGITRKWYLDATIHLFLTVRTHYVVTTVDGVTGHLVVQVPAEI